MSNPSFEQSARDFYWAFAGSLFVHFLVLMPSYVFIMPLASDSTRGSALTVSIREADDGKGRLVQDSPVVTPVKMGAAVERYGLPANTKMVFAKKRQSTVALSVGAETSAGEHAKSEWRINELNRVGIAPADLAQYQLSLARAARLVAARPLDVSLSGVKGRVVLSIQAAGGAGLPRVSIDKRSGIDALDDHAQEMMMQAVKSVPVPDQLNQRFFVIVVPIEYGGAE